ncbi:MAG: hypothetical protein ABSG96_16400 [Terracidiphilus sp.]
MPFTPSEGQTDEEQHRKGHASAEGDGLSVTAHVSATAPVNPPVGMIVTVEVPLARGTQPGIFSSLCMHLGNTGVL